MSSLPIDVKSLLTSLKNVAENGSFQTLIAKVLELDTEIIDLKGAKRVQDRQLYDMERRLEDAGKKLGERGKQLSALQGTLKEQEANINAIQTELRMHKKNAEDSLRSTKAALKDKSERLTELESCMLELKPTLSEDISESRFEILFQRAFELANQYFSNDLGVDGGRWNVLKGHKAVKDKISLPSADTPTAKKMRMGAFLAVLSSELSEHVFLPTYVPGAAGEFNRFLVDLAISEPELGAHLRSVLLKAHQEDNKRLMTRKHIQIATKNVFGCLEGPFSDRPEGRNFETDVEAICKEACDLWQYVQTLDESVTPSDGLFESSFKIINFSSLPLSVHNQRARSSGGTPAKISKTKLPANEPQSAPGRVVWPSLVIEDEILTSGYALSEDEVKEGKDEEKAEARLSRREARRKSRAPSMTEGDTETKRHFLYPKGGDGQKGT
ncbi:hypothetical protein B0H67DRAFT_257552 [Lasiosphaeris hirsuta]|uniref:Uncharacterized protein n=1 Tax=Lasiosphaeris hirsuta TaxID=260670 RepID=A0AA40AHX7_9PEZI|nr:hypothetical protein B0H67DRAFT_257552 [Lasiosphaeris hirsuta]